MYSYCYKSVLYLFNSKIATIIKAQFGEAKYGKKITLNFRLGKKISKVSLNFSFKITQKQYLFRFFKNKFRSNGKILGLKESISL